MELIVQVQQWENQTSIQHMTKDGAGFFKCYWVLDENFDRIFFSDFYVNQDKRNSGLGKQMIDSFHKFARLSGFKNSLLGAEKGSWMEAWYKRLGYEFHEEKDDNENWLIKKL